MRVSGEKKVVYSGDFWKLFWSKRNLKCHGYPRDFLNIQFGFLGEGTSVLMENKKL